MSVSPITTVYDVVSDVKILREQEKNRVAFAKDLIDPTIITRNTEENRRNQQKAADQQAEQKQQTNRQVTNAQAAVQRAPERVAQTAARTVNPQARQVTNNTSGTGGTAQVAPRGSEGTPVRAAAAPAANGQQQTKQPVVIGSILPGVPSRNGPIGQFQRAPLFGNTNPILIANSYRALSNSIPEAVRQILSSSQPLKVGTILSSTTLNRTRTLPALMPQYQNAGLPNNLALALQQQQQRVAQNPFISGFPIMPQAQNTQFAKPLSPLARQIPASIAQAIQAFKQSRQQGENAPVLISLRAPMASTNPEVVRTGLQMNLPASVTLAAPQTVQQGQTEAVSGKSGRSTRSEKSEANGQGRTEGSAQGRSSVMSASARLPVNAVSRRNGEAQRPMDQQPAQMLPVGDVARANIKQPVQVQTLSTQPQAPVAQPILQATNVYQPVASSQQVMTASASLSSAKKDSISSSDDSKVLGRQTITTSTQEGSGVTNGAFAAVNGTTGRESGGQGGSGQNSDQRRQQQVQQDAFA